jgi:peptide/nickel transport system substrate-binding protein
MATNDLQQELAEQMLDAVRRSAMPRREFIRRGTVMGLSVGSLAALLAACGGDDDSSGDTTAAAGTDAPTTTAGSAETTAGTTDTTAAPASEAKGTFRMAEAAPARDLEPLTGYGAGFLVMQMVHDYLVRVDNDFNVLPSVATEWAPTEGATVWTFTLRDDVVFHDGTPMTPATVVATYERMVNPDLKSAALSAFRGILSPGGVAVGADGKSVVFTLDRAFSDFPYLCSQANYTAMILQDDYAGDWLSNPIGTGAFKVDSVDPTTGAKLVRNDAYWDTGKPSLEAVEVAFYTDAQARVIAVQSDEADTTPIDFVTARALVSDDSIEVSQVGGTQTNILTMRVDTAPFDKKEVRQAIAWALDRAAVIERVLNGGGAEGNDHLFAPVYKSSPKDIEQRNVDQAKVDELLAGEKISFTLTYGATESASVAQVYLEQLKQAGFDVTAEEMPDDQFYGGDQEVDTPWLFRPATLVVWAGRPTPSQFIAPMLLSTGVWNGAKYNNPDFDAAAAAYDASETDADKAAQGKILAETMWEDCPAVITYWGGNARATKKGFTGMDAGYFDVASVAATD